MGLDAYVFLSKKHLPFDPDALGAKFDPDTGEHFFEGVELDRKYSLDARRTCRKRIGNITVVAELREEARRVLDEKSVVLSKVIYSGTHCGDTLKAEFFPALRRELAILRSGQASVAMLQFVADMEELIQAAIAERNPIVF